MDPLVNDFTAIHPSPGCWVYLIDFEKETIVMPYDDRGMDVVENNHEYLKELYHKFNHYLLDYDREIMDKTFLQ